MTVGKALGTILLSLLILTLTLGASGQVRAQTSPQEAAKFVEELGSEAGTLLAAVKTQGPEKRMVVLRDLVRRGFNLELTSQFVLGKFWNRATPEQRAEFQDLFTEYLLNSYVRHLGSYRAETLSIVASHPVGRKDVLVETSVEGIEGAASPVWRVRAEEGRYQIIDISIDGVSLALTQRREFAAVINSQGLDGLLEMLREKLAAQAKAAQLKPVKGELKLSLCQHPHIAQCEQVWDSSGAQVIGVLLPSSSLSLKPFARVASLST